MVSTLLSWMNSDFLLVPMVTGDEGKKTTVSIIRKLKVSHTTNSFCLFSSCGGTVLASASNDYIPPLPSSPLPSPVE